MTGTPNPNPYAQDEFLFHLYNTQIPSDGSFSQNALADPDAKFKLLTHRRAGDLLSRPGPNRPQAVISSSTDIAAWNGKLYPKDAPDAVKIAARECDFFKFSGLGLIQLTWRSEYLSCANSYVQAYNSATGEGVDDVTNVDLETAFLDPRVYLPSVYAYNKGCASAFQQACHAASVDDYAAYGHVVAEGANGPNIYGPNCYGPRCMALQTAMTQLGYTMGGSNG
jgi:hypothetical protein